MKEREIRYEPHPVTPERKAELVALGYRIIDARFKPAAESEAVSEPEKPAAASGGGRKGRGRA